MPEPKNYVYAFRAMALVGLLAGLISVAGCSGGNTGKASAAGGSRPPMAVPMITAAAAPVNATSEYLAVLKSRNVTTLNPQVDGQITKINVKSGDHVKAGTVLIQIDPLKQEATTGT